MIVQIVSRHHWETKLDRTRFLAVDPLGVKRTGVGWEGYDEADSIEGNIRNLFGELPDAVIAYKPLDHRGFDQLPCARVMQFNECRDDRFPQEIEAAKPTHLVFHHLNDFHKWFQRVDCQCAHIPHMADPAIFRDYDTGKDTDFLVVGSLGSVYPLRQMMAESVAILNDRGVRARIHQHPGHSFSDAHTGRHLVEFAQAISRSKIVGFCSSIYKYRLSKYPEVAACGSAVAADRPVEKQPQPMIEVTEDTPGAIADRIQQELPECESLWSEGREYAARHTPVTYSDALLGMLST